MNADSSGEKDKLRIKIFKQGTVTLVLFNSIQIAYSAGIQNVYGNNDGVYFVLNLVFQVLIFGIVIVVLLLLPCIDVFGCG